MQATCQWRRIPGGLKATCVNRWCPAPSNTLALNLHAPEEVSVNKHRWNGYECRGLRLDVVPIRGKRRDSFQFCEVSINVYADDNNNDVAKSNEDSKWSDLQCQKNIGAACKPFQTRVLDFL